MSTPTVWNEITANSPEETFELGKKVGDRLKGGELILLTGGLGAGKTVFTKGVMAALGYDADEVNSPSFTLVNLYQARLPVYHIDLWRLDNTNDAAVAVGLDDILEDDKAIAIIEWAEKLGKREFETETIWVTISGDGDEPRKISITSREHLS
jgi:tRNA threonylcarbamoyladenosine biosynthesis protein TsaE